MSKETLKPPLPPIDGRTEAAAERLFGLKWALRKDSTESIHKEWQTAPEWIRDGYLRQAIEVLSAADQADGATALQRHISEALADLQTLSGSEDIQISHALTMATIQASKALKQAHLMQDTADMLDQADQRDEENKISRMLMHKIAQQGE